MDRFAKFNIQDREGNAEIDVLLQGKSCLLSEKRFQCGGEIKKRIRRGCAIETLNK